MSDLSDYDDLHRPDANDNRSDGEQPPYEHHFQMSELGDTDDDMSGWERALRPDVLMSEPDEVPQPGWDEPAVTSLTLAEFVYLAKQLLRAGDMGVFAQFVLTGVHEGIQHQVDPVKDTLGDDHEIQALRDYDSVLGIHADICVDAPLTIYPVSKFEDTLRRNIHIKLSFTNHFGDHSDIPVHRIPNLCIAKWGTHNMIRVLLPGLYNGERRTPFLDQQELAAFYEKGLRPAVVELMGPSSAEWPPTYSAEMFRARGKNGTLAFQTKTLSSWLVGDLGDRIRRSLSDNDIPWGVGLQFLHQIRGVKASNGHSVTRDASRNALEDLIRANNLIDDGFMTGDWWVDVGLEIASKDHQCLAWRTDSHAHVVEDILRISTRNATRITRPGSSKYIRDMTSHLTSVSGCRISPGVRAQGPHEALYLQMYTTDKSITYRPEGTHFGKFLKGEDIIKGKADDYCHDLYELYRQAADKNYSLARVEVRVPLFNAGRVLLDININHCRDGLVSFEPIVWWSLRAYRVLAFKHLLAQQARGSSSLRGTDGALLLTAAAPWFLNGLHSAPDNGPSSRDLMGKILPLVNRVDADVQTLAYPASTQTRIQEVQEEEEEEEEGEDDEDVGQEGNDHEDNLSVQSALSEDDAPAPPNPQHAHRNRFEVLPYNPYGLVFLRDIRIGQGTQVPRFRDTGAGMITSKTFRYIFGIDRANVDDEFFKARILAPSNPRRVANKTHRTAARIIIENEEEIPTLFNLSARGYQLPPRERDEGSDVEVIELSDDELDNEARNEELDIDKRLTQLWRQFLVDLTAKAPNRKGAFSPSYCILTKLQRDRVNESTYQNLHLRTYFDDCQYRTATKAEWNAAFDKCWPPKGQLLTHKTQNYPRMKYYLAWGILINREDDSIPVEEMRQDLRKRFHTLKWIPNFQSDRVWYTKPDSSFKRFPESDSREAAPRILIRWNEQAII